MSYDSWKLQNKNEGLKEYLFGGWTEMVVYATSEEEAKEKLRDNERDYWIESYDEGGAHIEY